MDALQANGGTAIGDGLNLALDQLAQRPAEPDGQRPPPGTVVLLSDGESNFGAPPEQAGARAASEGVPVETVGIGERGRTALVGRNRVGLDEATLQQMAEQTGGHYFYAAEAAQLRGIYRDLSRRIGWVTEPTEITALFAGLGSVLMTAAGLLGLRWFQQFP
jgi:Ca-activated chloride channel family protein